jgi:hypothetical protein
MSEPSGQALLPPIFECTSATCKRLFYISQVASEVPGSTSGEVICPHCKAVCTTIEPDFGRFVVTDPLPLARENALRQEKGLPPLQ